ncbi:hypothetical protein EV210_1016 [Anaerospora hongkongensis]|uniref:Uncharacterized protein n=1 Tax=Anaerospora hongkongensis TaxID=244830 RepID=A0A4R1QBK2_9FIRM|nr:hypothetical protein [Anaerospora hongkongensis]TCL39811.1 hypothetical protein EV210_1016 [Anaerospora hongkongensis]
MAEEKIKDKCLCSKCKGIHTVSYSPGACEAVVACQQCGRLYYSLLYEQMRFGGEDILEEYQIPITAEEFATIKNTNCEELDLQFLSGREARLLFEGQVSKVNADLALKRCGR